MEASADVAGSDPGPVFVVTIIPRNHMTTIFCIIIWPHTPYKTWISFTQKGYPGIFTAETRVTALVWYVMYILPLCFIIFLAKLYSSHPPAVEAQNLNQWIARKVPHLHNIKHLFLYKLQVYTISLK